MSKWNSFFRGMAMLCLGMVIGFLISPIKQGVRISIGSNNRGSNLMNQGFDDEFDEEEYLDEYDFEPDFETPDDDDDDVVPF